MNLSGTRSLCQPIVVAGLFAFCFAQAPLAIAQDELSPWTVKTHLAITGSQEVFEVEQSSSDSSNAHLGFGAAVEYRLNQRLGFELGASGARTPDVEGTSNGQRFNYGDGPGFYPIWAGVNFHLLKNDRLDVYAGPRVAFVQFSDFELEVSGQQVEYTVDDDFAWGATIGVAYRLGGGNWALSAELTYLDVDMEVSEKGGAVTNVGFNPTTLGLGLAYRF